MYTTCAVIAIGASRNARNGSKSVVSSASAFVSTTGNSRMAVCLRTAMAGYVLDDWKHAGETEPLGRSTAQTGHDARVVGKGTIPDHRVRTVHQEIKDGCAIHVDPQRGEIATDQRVAGPRDRGCFCQVARCQLPEHGGRRIGRHMRGPQALHAAALLVNQDRNVAPGGFPQATDQGAGLGWRFQVTGKKNETKRIGLGEQRALVGPQLSTGNTEDDRKDHCPFATKQATPRSSSTLQIAPASFRDSNGPA